MQVVNVCEKARIYKLETGFYDTTGRGKDERTRAGRSIGRTGPIYHHLLPLQLQADIVLLFLLAGSCRISHHYPVINLRPLRMLFQLMP